jgi:hypothetical protein
MKVTPVIVNGPSLDERDEGLRERPSAIMRCPACPCQAVPFHRHRLSRRRFRAKCGAFATACASHYKPDHGCSMNDAEAQSSVAGQSFKSIFSWWYESSFLPGSAFSSSGRFFSSQAWNLNNATSSLILGRRCRQSLHNAWVRSASSIAVSIDASLGGV